MKKIKSMIKNRFVTEQHFNWTFQGIRRTTVGILYKVQYSTERENMSNKIIRQYFYIKDWPKITNWLNNIINHSPRPEESKVVIKEPGLLEKIEDHFSKRVIDISKIVDPFYFVYTKEPYGNQYDKNIIGALIEYDQEKNLLRVIEKHHSQAANFYNGELMKVGYNKISPRNPNPRWMSDEELLRIINKVLNS